MFSPVYPHLSTRSAGLAKQLRETSSTLLHRIYIKHDVLATSVLKNKIPCIKMQGGTEYNLMF